ncbi:nucleotidyltransferase family protein [Flavobacterium rhizosphaerae]|uniref:Nucleotidyltransferase family protein n=1 Tax=Flavobacterium rhizosphaerae TaxID=3163298 RepID=A0ABW8YUJ3_9FLAO
MNTGIILLAAGNSSRLGQPKQLLEYKGETLLNRVINEAVCVAGNAVIVVTGYDTEKIEDSIKNRNVLICYNQLWQEGMATSITAGLKQLLLVYPDLQSCIISVCDQPYLNACVFKGIYASKAEQKKGIVAAKYRDTVGVPALFSKTYFDALLNLRGTQGARGLLSRYKNDVILYAFENGAFDIDTMEDYNKLIK